MISLKHWKVLLLVLSAVIINGSSCVEAADTPFAWQCDYARIAETGNIEWTPQPFLFVTGPDVRFIDYERGSDDNDGASIKQPWKHHPWDSNAAGKSAAAQKVSTAVFKGGVIYRGQLMVKEHGKPGTPIRLTRDPDWGNGPAIIAGSERVTGWKQGAEHPKIPDPDKVWKVDLDFTPRTLWMITDAGKSVRIPLARHPNWKSQPEDHKAQWFNWTNDPHPFQRKDGFSANDSKNLKGCDPDFVQGALIYSEFGWVMGTPYPSKVSKYDPKNGEVGFEQWTGGGNASVIFRNMRYYLEDKPQYLDDQDGEFWFDKKGNAGTLYLRLPGNADPNKAHIEVGRYADLVTGKDVNYLEISGLDFRWTTQPWNLDVAFWDFGTKPWGARADATPACIRFFGKAEDICIANCNFEDVVMGIRMQSVESGDPVRNITVQDSVFKNTDVGAAHFSDGSGWGFARPFGILDDIHIYRNYAVNNGFRATRYERGCTFSLAHPLRAHIAGNVIERCGAQAINVVGGKGSGMRGDVPFIRILIHQNKAWKTMQNANDFGGIESWQHGPVYIFNNLSFDARGQQEGRRVVNNGCAGFGHAYYLDGGFKNYLFNNIAWGLSNDPKNPLVNCAAFQEIHSFQNVFFNNTVYNYTVGSRRQAPHAGRDMFLGNIWQGISDRVFRHSDPAKTEADGNAQDAGKQKEKFDYENNAYAKNIFYDIAQMGVFETSGRWLKTLEDFGSALRVRQSLESSLGTMDSAAPLRDPGHGDFRLNKGSAAIDHGAVSFVPWALYGVVAEWNFYHAGNDHKTIIDEHWYAKDYMAERTEYHQRPTYPLTVVNVTPEDYVQGILENFTAGALQFVPARKTYATISDSVLDKQLTVKLASRAKHGQDPQIQPVTFEGDGLKTPEIYESNFLIEVVFNAKGDGLIIGKRDGTGYAIELKDGRAVFSVKGVGGKTAELISKTQLNDGKWQHLVAEADRGAMTLALYVNGRLDSSGPGIGKDSLANDGDLYVGGTPDGNWLDGTLEFIRIAHGTLADADTTIGELFAWEFRGPSRRDMRGAKAMGGGRDAGALESF